MLPTTTDTHGGWKIQWPKYCAYNNQDVSSTYTNKIKASTLVNNYDNSEHQTNLSKSTLKGAMVNKVG